MSLWTNPVVVVCFQLQVDVAPDLAIVVFSSFHAFEVFNSSFLTNSSDSVIQGGRFLLEGEKEMYSHLFYVLYHMQCFHLMSLSELSFFPLWLLRQDYLSRTHKSSCIQYYTEPGGRVPGKI